MDHLGGPYVITEVFRSPVSGLWLPAFGPLMVAYAEVVYLYIAYGAILLITHHRPANSAGNATASSTCCWASSSWSPALWRISPLP